MKRYDVLSGVSQRTGDPDMYSHGSVHNSCHSIQSTEYRVGAAWIFSL